MRNRQHSAEKVHVAETVQVPIEFRDASAKQTLFGRLKALVAEYFSVVFKIHDQYEFIFRADNVSVEKDPAR